MPSIKSLIHTLLPDPLDTTLKKGIRCKAKTILLVWNRGLGDIPLVLYGVIKKIRDFIPDAKITILTRGELSALMETLPNVNVFVDLSMHRGKKCDIKQSLINKNIDPDTFDLFIEHIDIDRSSRWQIGTFCPKIRWDPSWDELYKRFNLDPHTSYIGCHIDTETRDFYGHEKNWPLEYWEDLFIMCEKENGPTPILFGHKKTGGMRKSNIIDLRGKTSLFEIFSLIKYHCDFLLTPDSGIFSTVYYLNTSFPLHIVSLVADPKRGVVGQNVASPNPCLSHIALIPPKKTIAALSPEVVYNALFHKHSKTC